MKMELLAWVSRQPGVHERRAKLVALITALTDATPACFTAHERHLLADFVVGRLSMEEVAYAMDVENERRLAYQQLRQLRAARYFPFAPRPTFSLN